VVTAENAKVMHRHCHLFHSIPSIIIFHPAAGAVD
jgi:hypothetical protein